MTVRWKPLLLLSGLFAVIALVGVIAMAFTLIPQGRGRHPARGPRGSRRAVREGEIYYKQARQMDGKNPAVHEETRGPVRGVGQTRPGRTAGGAPRPRVSPRWPTPRRTARRSKGPRPPAPERRDGAGRGAESLYWAKQVLTLEPKNADAHFVLAAAALDDRLG